MNIVRKDLASLKPHPDNEKTYHQEKNDALGDIHQSMVRDGYDTRYPMLINKKGELLDGMTRREAAQMAGHKQAPCIEFEGTEAEEKLAIIKANCHRTRSKLQKARELLLRLEAEELLAKDRMSAILRVSVTVQNPLHRTPNKFGALWPSLLGQAPGRLRHHQLPHLALKLLGVV